MHQELIDRCYHGDKQAQFRIYELYYKAMFNACLRIVGADVEAEYGGVSYDGPAQVSRVDRNNAISVNGRVGESSNPKANVWVRVRYGSANLQ